MTFHLRILIIYIVVDEDGLVVIYSHHLLHIFKKYDQGGFFLLRLFTYPGVSGNVREDLGERIIPICPDRKAALGMLRGLSEENERCMQL